MTKSLRLREIVFIAVALGLLVLLLVPHHGPSHDAFFALLNFFPVLLFVPIDFRRVLLGTGQTVAYAMPAAPDRPSRFQRPPPQTRA